MISKLGTQKRINAGNTKTSVAFGLKCTRWYYKVNDRDLRNSEINESVGLDACNA